MRKFCFYFFTGLMTVFLLWSLALAMLAPVVNWSKASGWQSVSVTLASAEIVKWGTNSRDRSLRVNYSYVWQGTSYTGSRISAHSPSVSMPDKIQRSLLARFTRESEQGVLQAYVNPDQPADSMLDRKVYPGWLAMNVYQSIIMLWFFYGAFWLFRTFANNDTKSAESSEKIEPAAESPAWKVVAYFACLFSLFSAGLVVMIIEHMKNGDYGVLAFLMFPVATVGLWWMTRYCWVRRFEPDRVSPEG